MGLEKKRTEASHGFLYKITGKQHVIMLWGEDYEWDKIWGTGAISSIQMKVLNDQLDDQNIKYREKAGLKNVNEIH